MAASAAPRTAPLARPVPAVSVPGWAWAMAGAGVLALHLTLQDNGALLSSAAGVLHELTHDGRHALGLPCH